MLDWETKPLPFKVYPGLEQIRLPTDLPALAVDTFCGRSFGESAVDSRTSWPPHRATKVCAACKKIALRRRA